MIKSLSKSHRGFIERNALEHPYKTTAQAQAYTKNSFARYEHKVSICYILNKFVADKKLSDIYKTNTNLSAKPRPDEQLLT